MNHASLQSAASPRANFAHRLTAGQHPPTLPEQLPTMWTEASQIEQSCQSADLIAHSPSTMWTAASARIELRVTAHAKRRTLN